MNIWIVNHYAIPPSLGGLVRHYYFSRYLTAQGHRVRLFTSSKIHNTDVNMVDNGDAYRVQEMDGVEYTFVRSSDYHGNGLSRIKNMLEFPHRVRKVCRQFAQQEGLPDVIYTSSPDLFTAWAAVRMAHHYHRPVVVEVRDLWPESIVDYKHISRRNPVIRVLYRLEKWVYRQADRLIFTMEGGADYVRDRGWEKAVPPAKIRHVNNGVDLEEFARHCRDFVTDDPDLQDDSVWRIVYTGSVREANNVGFLVDAAKLLQQQEVPVRFLIYGDGTERAALEQRLIDEHITNVRFKGHVDKKYIPYILTRAHLNVLNCRPVGIWHYGGSQNKLFEYFASGRPVLTNIQMRYDPIRQYDAGRVLDESTPEKLAEAIVAFRALDEQAYRRYCDNALTAAQAYDFNTLSRRIEEILHEAAER